MTVLEYTKASLSVSSIIISDDYLKAQLIASGLDPDAEMSNNEMTSVKEALYNLLPIILTAPKSITEGGYSISYDKGALLSLYRLLAKQLDKPDLLDEKDVSIEDITDIW